MGIKIWFDDEFIERPGAFSRIGSSTKRGNDALIDYTHAPAKVNNHVQTDAGIWVPQKGTNDGSLKTVTQLTGSNVQLSSVQETNSATTVKTYTAATGATKLTVYCESGSIRIRSDGQPCTATTGAPLGEGWAQDFNVASISIYFVEQATITVVSE